MTKLLKISGVAVFLFILWIVIAPLFAYLLIVEVEREHSDALIVLSGSSVYKERTKKAADLFKVGRTNKIILTDDGFKGGWSSREKRNPYFVELAKNELTSQGVPESAIIVLSGIVDGTDKEALIFLAYAKENDVQSVTIVTSAYHTRRALWTFEKFAKNGDFSFGVEHPAVGIQTPKAFSWWLNKKGWQMIAGEYVKFIGYYIYYWQV